VTPIIGSVPPPPEEVEASQLLPMLAVVAVALERIQYLRLKKELTEGSNPEINTDREVLISRMEQLGFRREIVDALRDLEPKLMAAATPLELKGCIDVIRTVFEEIVEDAAKKAAALTSAKVPSGKLKDFQPWKDLLSTAGVLTTEEADLFQKFYNYFSNVGSHRLGSGHEHVRVARNTVIEWGMLLVGRVQALTVK
jgi:hypothetical protein